MFSYISKQDIQNSNRLDKISKNLMIQYIIH
jgi:hypothetical protein